MHQDGLPRRISLSIYVICFGIGVVTHTLDFLAGWPRPYSWAPALLEIFWSALILLDALVIIMLLTRRLKSGLMLSAAIMLADVLANSYAFLIMRLSSFAFSLPLQAIFLGFVLGSIGFLWPRTSQSPDA